MLVTGYPRNLKEEYPDIPFKTVDSAFSIASSIFFFKGIYYLSFLASLNNSNLKTEILLDYEFWQSDWNTNLTGKIPFKASAAVSWRNPRLDSSMTEPLAYIVSNSSMYKFNFWSIPISQETLDIRYFLFDCVQSNYKPHNPLFLGPSYKQAFIADDVYMKNIVRSPRLVIRQAPDEVAATAVVVNSTKQTQNVTTTTKTTTTTPTTKFVLKDNSSIAAARSVVAKLQNYYSVNKALVVERNQMFLTLTMIFFIIISIV